MVLYRAADSTGQTLDCLVSENTSTRAAKRLFGKVLGRSDVTAPRVINIEKGDIQGQNQFIAGLFGLTV